MLSGTDQYPQSNAYLASLTMFGDGSLGDLYATGAVAITGDSNYANVMVASGGNISVNGYFLRAQNQLTIRSGGIINCDGKAGTDGPTASAGAMTATAGVAGGEGAYTTRRGWFAYPPAGGNGGGCATAASAATGVGGAQVTALIASAYAPLFSLCGGGGGGGGVVVVYYRNSLGTGVGTLSAAGGAAGTSGYDGQAGANGLTASFEV